MELVEKVAWALQTLTALRFTEKRTMASINPNFIAGMLSDFQSLILAYYKKEYLSGSCHPPLTYDVYLFGHMLRRGEVNHPLAVFHMGPDSIRHSPPKPYTEPATTGSFYRTGIGWITPDRHERRVRLVLCPRKGIFFKQEYELPSR